MSENINMDFESTLKQSLESGLDSVFTERVMAEARLSAEFVREDKKTFITVKYLLAIFGVIFVSVSAYFVSALKENLTVSQDGGDNVLEKIYYKVTNLSSELFNVFGLTASGEAVFYIMVLMICVFVFLAAEKIILRKSYR